MKNTSDGRFAGTGKGAKVRPERLCSIERCWLGKPRLGERPRNDGWPLTTIVLGDYFTYSERINRLVAEAPRC